MKAKGPLLLGFVALLASSCEDAASSLADRTGDAAEAEMTADAGPDGGGVDADAGDGGEATADGGMPVLVFCPNAYFDLVEGEVVTIPVDGCAAGAVCGTGMAYVVCPAGGGEVVIPGGSGGQFSPITVANDRRSARRYPFCEVDADCGQGVCLLSPGCGARVGLCCASSLCASRGIRPLWDCRSLGCSTYCGCDGRTFEGLPNVPFAYPGPCR